MIQTITPIDNTVYVEREYHSNKIEETIENSMNAQKDWANLTVSERVKLLKNFVHMPTPHPCLIILGTPHPCP